MKASDLKIASEILEERERQREKWSATHDRDHTGDEWIAVLAERLGKAATATLGTGRDGGPSLFRLRLIQLAAVAIAAIEREDALPDGRTIHDYLGEHRMEAQA